MTAGAYGILPALTGGSSSTRSGIMGLLCAFVVAALAGIGPPPARAAAAQPEPAPASRAPAGLTGRQIPSEMRAEVDSVRNGDTAFAFDLYDRLRSQDGNLILSPYSLSAALAMTWAGARGTTGEEMARVLHLALPPSRVHTAFAAMRGSLEADSTAPYKLVIANRLWGEEGSAWLEPFLAITREEYGAGLQQLSFSRDPEGSRHTINSWVEEKTIGRIRELVPQGMIKSETRLVLTNAVYFNGTWAAPFDTNATRPDIFRVAGGKIVTPMMTRTAAFGHASRPDLEILELPYKGGDLSLVILLPRREDGIRDLERELRADSLASWLGSLKREEIQLHLPRFRFTSAFSLGKTLRAMGMTSAFAPGADFSGMDGQRDLFISAVLHKAFGEVNERGTEAAAGSAVLMSWGIPKHVYFVPRTIYVDHPFLFLIRDTVTGSVLFLGRVMDPTRP